MKNAKRKSVYRNVVSRHHSARSECRNRRRRLLTGYQRLDDRRLLAADFTFNLLHASDLEGGVTALEDAPRFSAVVESLRQESNAAGIDTLLLSSGDNYIPGPFFNAGGSAALDGLLGDAAPGRADIAIMNAIGFDAAAIGNHEFDAGPAVFASAISPDGAWEGAQFPYLSANLDFSGEPALSPLVEAGAQAAASIAGRIAPSTLITVGGQSIGVVGATTPLLETISSAGGVDALPDDPNNLAALAGILQPEIDSLIAAGSNKIILVSHLQQLQVEQDLAGLLSGLDIIIAGGSDTLLADSTDRLRTGDVAQGPYPLLTSNADGDPLAIISTDGEYSYVGRLVVGFDAAGVLDVSTIDENVSGTYATDAQGVADLGGTPNPEVVAIVNAIAEVLEEDLTNFSGRTSVYLNGNRASVRTEETNLGNLTADANLAVAQAIDSTVQVSLKNGGGIRAPIGIVDDETGDLLPPQGDQFRETGQINQIELEDALRFDNSLSLLTVTADQLRRVFEHGVSATALGATPGQFPQVGGVEFSFNPSLPAGARVQSLAIVDEQGNLVDAVVQNGETVGDPDRPIRVVTLGFLADGGDGYFVGDQGTPTNVVDIGIGEQAALSEYLRSIYDISPFAQADTPAEADRRIQNLTRRADTVFEQDVLNLTQIGTYATGVFDEGAAEIVAYDAETQRAYFSNADANSVGILDLSDPTNPTLISEISLDAFGGGVNSVAVAGGIVAVAVEADVSTDPGTVAFFDIDGNPLGDVTVGALPDNIKFTPDGTKVVVAGEGEPDDGVDPMGTISVISLAGGVAAATVAILDFSEFDDQRQALIESGVRVFPGQFPSTDFEPEFVSITPDGSTAYVTLQEANAVAVVDLASETITGIQPLGLKDFSKGLPELTTFDINDRGLITNGGAPLTTATGETIELGGFSGLWFEETTPAGNLRFLTVPDRGPNGDPIDLPEGTSRPFLLPEYQARVVTLDVNPVSGEVQIVDELLLTRADGTTPITGLPNIPNFDERAVDANNDPVDLASLTEIDASAFGTDYDPLGADLEGIVRASDGTLWMVDEYRPAIYHFAADGTLIDRFVPEGTVDRANDANPGATFAEGTFGTETLPAEYLNRRANRGFEGMALDTDTGILYAFIQTPLNNPNRATGDASRVIRMIGIDATTGEPVAEYVYLLQKPEIGNNVDKIGDAVYAGQGKFFVMERDSSLEANAQKFIFEVNLIGATNVLGQDFGSSTLEQLSPDDLESLDVSAVNKIKVANLPSLGYLPSDKPEGLAVLPDGSLAVLNDNDFGLVPGAEPVQLGVITFTQPNGLDASDRDDAINIQNWPVFGTFMPDAIATFEIGGEIFYATANEGDDRGDADDADDSPLGDAIRLKDLADVETFGFDGLSLDPSLTDAFPGLEEDEQLGRLTISAIDGDLDGDGDLDQIHGYGTRSFTIWDSNGNLVFDSGDDFEQITASAFPEFFNSDNSEPNFDNRSDNKGPEPEAVTTGVIGGRTYAFVGLERIGGIMVYDVTTPAQAKFVQYINNRDFSVDPENADGSSNPAAGDAGVEDLVFIAAADSPTGQPLLLSSNEVSGTVTVFRIDLPGAISSDPLIAADEDGDDLTVKRDGDELVVSNGSGDEVLRQPIAATDSLTVVGSSRKDSLTIDLTGGDFNLPFGIEFDGGRGSDSLIVVGSASRDLVDVYGNVVAANGLISRYTAVESVVVESDGGDDLVGVTDPSLRIAGVLDEPTISPTARQIALDGGSSDDTYVFDAVTARITVDDASGFDTVDLSGSDTGVTLSLASRGNQRVTRNLRVKLRDDIEALIGSEFDDRLFGSFRDDLILGLGGDDHIIGGLFGNDILVGGDGSDRVIGGSGRDLIIGGAGGDLLWGGLGDDILIAGFTRYDNDVESLKAILNAWEAPTSFVDRVDALMAGVGDGGQVRLVEDGDDPTVFDDLVDDRLLGFFGKDNLLGT